MKPAISYYGGKQKMASKIVPLIPVHTVYVEPFAGGAAIFFAKPFPNVSNTAHYIEVLNDLDNRLINFYRVLRDPKQGPELVHQLQLTPYSEEEHRIAKNLDIIDIDPIEAARRYYINIMQSFANKLNGGWARSVYSGNKALTFYKKIQYLPEILDRLSGVYVSSTDALKCIKQWDSPHTFFYCDPPYPNTDQSGYMYKFSLEDMKKLVDCLNECQGSFILSCYDIGIEWPEDWEKFEFSTTMSASGQGKTKTDRSKFRSDEELGDRKRTELVFRRFNRVPMRADIQKIVSSKEFDCFCRKPLN